MNATRNTLPAAAREISGELLNSAAVQRVTMAKDFGTADLLADLPRDLDKQLWILEAHLNRSDLPEAEPHDHEQTFAH